MAEGRKRGILNPIAESVKRALSSKYAFIAAALIIAVLAVAVRTTMLQYQGLFEPDGFYYYSVVREAINNGLTIPQYPSLSGFPNHNMRGEQQGLIYLTLVPWLILQHLGISYLTIMRLIAPAFGVLYLALSYLLAKQLANSRSLGLLAMFFVAASNGNVARTAALVYRGDSFITLPLMVALLLMLMALKHGRRRVLYSVLASVALSTGMVVWSGSPYTVAIYILALIMMIGYEFVAGRKEMIETNVILTLSLFLVFMLQHLYVFAGLGRAVGEFYGLSFFVFWMPVLIASLVALYLTGIRHKFALLDRWQGRAEIALAVAFVVAVLAYFPLTAYIGNVVFGTTAATAPGTVPIGATTQEQQRTTLPFLWASFNLQLFLVPLGVMLFPLISGLMGGGEKTRLRGVPVNISSAFIVMLAFLAVTGYMQSLAIRFNAVVSVPIAIFAAYAIYSVGMFLKARELKGTLMAVVPSVAVDATLVYIALFKLRPLLDGGSPVLTAGTALVIMLMSAAIALSVYSIFKRRLFAFYMFACLAVAMLVFDLALTYVGAASAAPADGINAQFLTAMTWLSNNTPRNATVLAVWPDGSVVEAWGSRQSYMDSVGGENGTRIGTFSAWLFNTTPDPRYLYSVHKPNYIVARSFWYSELGGLAQEGLVQNDTNYGFVALTTAHVGRNGSIVTYNFTQTQAPFYRALFLLNNGTNGFAAYIGVGNSGLAPIRYVMLYNSDNFNYTVLRSAVNASLNYTLLISYSGGRITGATILGLRLPPSNLFKLTFLCNYQLCPYGAGNVTMRPVYINGDTRIIQVSYTG